MLLERMYRTVELRQGEYSSLAEAMLDLRRGMIITREIATLVNDITNDCLSLRWLVQIPSEEAVDVLITASDAKKIVEGLFSPYALKEPEPSLHCTSLGYHLPHHYLTLESGIKKMHEREVRKLADKMIPLKK